MKLRLIVMLLLSFLCISNSLQAKTEEEKQEEARTEQRKLTAEKLTELNGTSWEVSIQSASGKGSLVGADTLTFQDEMFTSQKAAKAGWTPTNYTLTVQEGGPTVWETMQTSADAGVAFWRGEWKEDVMSGVISRQVKDQPSEEYTFTSSSKANISPTSEKAEEEAAESSESTFEIPVQETLVSKTPAVESEVSESVPEAPKKTEVKSVAEPEEKKKSAWFF